MQAFITCGNLPVRQYPFIEGLGLGQPALRLIEHGQVGEAHGDVGMAGRQSLLAHLSLRKGERVARLARPV